jgi:hypothetical protein
MANASLNSNSEIEITLTKLVWQYLLKKSNKMSYLHGINDINGIIKSRLNSSNSQG